jgi:hypothetical protein
VVGDRLKAMGFSITAMPDSNFHMKPLVNAIAAAL